MILNHDFKSNDFKSFPTLLTYLDLLAHAAVYRPIITDYESLY